jgi:hypothetical protein
MEDGFVRSIAWAPNGATLAVGSAHHVRLLDASTEGRELTPHALTGGEFSVRSRR